MRVDFTIVEKDFWVCWTLKALFALPVGNPTITFKGGTSLAKAYELIDRFSEDIDVAIDPDFFTSQGHLDPEEPGISKTQRAKRMDGLDAACITYVATQLLPTLSKNFSTRLNSDEQWTLDFDPGDANTLLFSYPQSNPGNAYGYLRDTVKIELGWRAKTAPAELKVIAPFLAEIPTLLEYPQVTGTVLVPDRTFWEKVTALHAESFRAEPKAFISRHYSDVAAMLRTAIGKQASRDLAMLEDVRVFKDSYYRVAWARYDLARPGSLVVIPSQERLRELASDYRNMRQMFLSEPPPFDAIIDELRAFEREING